VRRAVQLSSALLLVALVASGCSDDGTPDRAATERMFLETCAPSGEPEEERVCRCAFDRIADDLTDEELRDLDRRVRGGPESIPPEITEAALECAAEPLTPSTP
jgi:hypothetical protein